jgi:nucleotide-binding universal stress UspA family protein
MISRILVPHDGTEMSDQAFEKAVELAKMFKAELVLLHVIEHVLEIPLPVHLIFDDIDVINRARRTARKELEKGWEKMVEVKTHEIESDNVDLTGECKYGSAAEQILRSAKTNKIDMIVMGSHRLKGISKIKALGSVTRKVSESADCPVLIVR